MWQILFFNKVEGLQIDGLQEIDMSLFPEALTRGVLQKNCS